MLTFCGKVSVCVWEILAANICIQCQPFYIPSCATRAGNSVWRRAFQTGQLKDQRIPTYPHLLDWQKWEELSDITVTLLRCKGSCACACDVTFTLLGACQEDWKGDVITFDRCWLIDVQGKTEKAWLQLVQDFICRWLILEWIYNLWGIVIAVISSTDWKVIFQTHQQNKTPAKYSWKRENQAFCALTRHR